MAQACAPQPAAGQEVRWGEALGADKGGAWRPHAEDTGRGRGQSRGRMWVGWPGLETPAERVTALPSVPHAPPASREVASRGVPPPSWEGAV